MECIGLHSEVMGREIIQTWGSAFIKVVSGMPRTLWVYITMENLQDNSKNYLMGRKVRSLKAVSYLNYPVLSKRGM